MMMRCFTLRARNGSGFDVGARAFNAARTRMLLSTPRARSGGGVTAGTASSEETEGPRALAGMSTACPTGARIPGHCWSCGTAVTTCRACGAGVFAEAQPPALYMTAVELRHDKEAAAVAYARCRKSEAWRASASQASSKGKRARDLCEHAEELANAVRGDPQRRMAALVLRHADGAEACGHATLFRVPAAGPPEPTLSALRPPAGQWQWTRCSNKACKKGKGAAELVLTVVAVVVTPVELEWAPQLAGQHGLPVSCAKALKTLQAAARPVARRSPPAHAHRAADRRSGDRRRLGGARRVRRCRSARLLSRGAALLYKSTVEVQLLLPASARPCKAYICCAAYRTGYALMFNL